jgi:hypothetical protein
MPRHDNYNGRFIIQDTEGATFKWSCRGCDRYSEQLGYSDKRNGPIQAFNDAHEHATKCLNRLRIEQGTNEWPTHYLVRDFISDYIDATAQTVWVDVKLSN